MKAGPKSASSRGVGSGEITKVCRVWFSDANSTSLSSKIKTGYRRYEIRNTTRRQGDTGLCGYPPVAFFQAPSVATAQSPPSQHFHIFSIFGTSASVQVEDRRRRGDAPPFRGGAPSAPPLLLHLTDNSGAQPQGVLLFRTSRGAWKGPPGSRERRARPSEMCRGG